MTIRNVRIEHRIRQKILKNTDFHDFFQKFVRYTWSVASPRRATSSLSALAIELERRELNVHTRL